MDAFQAAKLGIDKHRNPDIIKGQGSGEYRRNPAQREPRTVKGGAGKRREHGPGAFLFDT
jgi:hypothetical protein